MNFLRFFSRPQSAPAARERLQVLLAHERALAGDSDLVSKLRDEILRVIAKHMQINDDKVSVKMERGAQMSTLAVDIEIPFDPAKKDADKKDIDKKDVDKKDVDKKDTGKKAA
ncbi:cell division topological specificity factor MinE [Methylovirgula sp. 4M-Z18]|uniref:cell division topological specificity factor MinE n=1 Tax=Methylovirgula sp. 4M-Z18 TaxID=2293567 RepID=UPI000E2F465B|nr:cell division topological specificity factor MinE [Methylovirgula sp. 4M-Z18]RFB78181.1 cell division topological specificity factor MinE [Methylovirgula sp. 4M-Z18]